MAAGKSGTWQQLVQHGLLLPRGVLYMRVRLWGCDHDRDYGHRLWLWLWLCFFGALLQVARAHKTKLVRKPIDHDLDNCGAFLHVLCYRHPRARRDLRVRVARAHRRRAAASVSVPRDGCASYAGMVAMHARAAGGVGWGGVGCARRRRAHSIGLT